MLAFFRTEPRGERRADLRVGHQSALLLSSFRGKGSSAIDPNETTVAFQPKDSSKPDEKGKLGWLIAWAQMMGAETPDEVIEAASRG